MAPPRQSAQMIKEKRNRWELLCFYIFLFSLCTFILKPEPVTTREKRQEEPPPPPRRSGNTTCTERRSDDEQKKKMRRRKRSRAGTNLPV